MHNSHEATAFALDVRQTRGHRGPVESILFIDSR